MTINTVTLILSITASLLTISYLIYNFYFLKKKKDRCSVEKKK